MIKKVRYLLGIPFGLTALMFLVIAYGFMWLEDKVTGSNIF